jgi:FkbM family methyltransferase
VLDIGAHVGYYTLLSAVLAGEHGTVWSFEPHPRNCAWLRGHIALNGLANVRIEEAAMGAHEGTTRFVEGTGSGTGHVAAEGGLVVRVHRLDDFCREHDITPDVVKLDVEGAEADVVAAARDVLTRARPVLFLSTHGPDVHNRCLSLLEELGYCLSPILGDDIRRTSEVLCEPPAP